MPGRLSKSVIARSRGARNREHTVTFRATEIIDIVHHPDACGAWGFTERTRGWWHQEKMDALLDGGLSHLLPHRSHRPDRDACFEFLFQLQECIVCRLKFLFQFQERIACGLASEAHRFNGGERGLYAR